MTVSTSPLRTTAPPELRSRSRKVNAYVRAVQRAQRLKQRYDAQLGLLRPLRTRLELAVGEVQGRRGALTGGQLAEAERLLRAAP